MKKIIRALISKWAKAGFAPGLLHSQVDKYASFLSDGGLIQSVYQSNKMLCNLKDHVQSRIYFFKAYEPIETYLLLDLIDKDSHILDAGANVGFYSLVLSSKLSHKGRVYAFEPVLSNREQLIKNIELSNNDKITVFPKGLWDKEDTLHFSLENEQSENQGSFTAALVQNPNQSISAEVLPLDQVYANNQIDRVDYIKMDIEGSELRALKGAMGVIEKYRPTILMEINQQACHKMGYSSESIDNLLLPLGYKIFLVNSLSENSRFIDSTKSLTQNNVFFLNHRDQDRILTNWNYKEIKKFFYDS